MGRKYRVKLISLTVLAFAVGSSAVYHDATVPSTLLDRLGLRAPQVNLPGDPIQQPLWGHFYPAWRSPLKPLLKGKDPRDVLFDPASRIEREFQVTSGLKDRVLFWARIYSSFTSAMKVIHDRNDPSLIYGYIDFSDIAPPRAPFTAVKKARHIERTVLNHLRNSFLQVLRKGTSRPLDTDDEKLFVNFLVRRGVRGGQQLYLLRQNLRSQRGQADQFLLALERSRSMLPDIERVFQSEGLPRALARIPFVESSFNVEARSKVGAIGLWQFVPMTAREMIDRNNRSEWHDPSRQTYAAAKLLLRYRSALSDWGTTVTSYNAGIGRVSRVLKRVGSSSMEELLASLPNGSGRATFLSVALEEDGIGFAAQNFYAEVLAANLVEAYKTELFSSGLVLDPLVGLRAVASSPNVAVCWYEGPEPSHAIHNRMVASFPRIIAAGVSSMVSELRRWLPSILQHYSL